jgi:cytochrome P450
MTATGVESIELRGWQQVREALRAKDLRQAGYTEGAVVMADCLLDLHGDAHRERRRLENRLFRREIFSYWENEVLGSTIRATLMPFVEAGRGDLAQIGYRSAMNLTAMIAGIDHDPTDVEATERLYAIVKKFSEGATLIHSTRDKDEVRTEVREAMARFEAEQFIPSMRRRREIIEEVAAGARDESDLPHDVLTTLLRNEDRLDLPHDVQMREISFYLQAGAHSTANAFTHTVDDLLAWGESHPEDLERARDDLGFVQRCMHESLRLNPASPVATRMPLSHVRLSDGTVLAKGSTVVLDLTAANRDESVFGPSSDRFDPHRDVPDGIPPWGLSFGAGTHACIGAELDGGMEISGEAPPPDHLYGTVAIMARTFLEAGGRADPEDPPQLDPNSVRRHFSRYPVVFGSQAKGRQRQSRPV